MRTLRTTEYAHTIASTPLQYRSHIERNFGWPVGTCKCVQKETQTRWMSDLRHPIFSS